MFVVVLVCIHTIVNLLSTETFISIIIVINSVNISNTVVVYYHQCCHHQENLHLYRHRWYVDVVFFLPYVVILSS